MKNETKNKISETSVDTQMLTDEQLESVTGGVLLQNYNTKKSFNSEQNSPPNQTETGTFPNSGLPTVPTIPI